MEAFPFLNVARTTRIPDIVKESWDILVNYLGASEVLFTKLRPLQEPCEGGSKGFWLFLTNKRQVALDIDILEKCQEERELTWEELDKLQNLRIQIHQIYIKKEEIMWSQRARVNWVKQGDLNTAFFHKMANMRNRKNKILSLKAEREIIKDKDRIRGIIHELFKKKKFYGKAALRWSGSIQITSRRREGARKLFGILPNPFLRRRSKW